MLIVPWRSFVHKWVCVCCLQDLTNVELFMTSREVEESLKRKETGPCLTWCHDNRYKLRKHKVNCTAHHFLLLFLFLLSSETGALTVLSEFGGLGCISFTTYNCIRKIDHMVIIHRSQQIAFCCCCLFVFCCCFGLCFVLLPLTFWQQFAIINVCVIVMIFIYWAIQAGCQL